MGLKWADFDFFRKLLKLAASKFNKAYLVAFDSPYIFTKNDITSYFRSAAHRINVFILGPIRVAIYR